MERLTDRIVRFWLPVLLLFMLGIAWSYSQNVPLIAFQCKDGICVTTEQQVDHFEKMLGHISDLIRKLQAENDKLKGQCT